jgi:hypothetical protein
MIRRFQRNVWQHAPAELIATEFLSLLRSLLAPIRVELALYDMSGDRTLAATLPSEIGREHNELGITPLAARAFFNEGGKAAARWATASRKIAPQDLPEAEHLSAFGEPRKINLSNDGATFLKVVTHKPISFERLQEVVKQVDLAPLLRAHESPAQPFRGEWQSLSRRLTDYLLHEFIDRLENDLSVLLESEAPEIWLLLMKDGANRSEPSLQFHTSRPKLERVLEHYQRDSALRSERLTVDALIRRIEGDAGVVGGQGDFRRLMTPCYSDFHRDLDWAGSSELTVDHLECIAEKFEDGWPVNRGIAGTVVATGCAEVIRDFASDYRVKAYEYGGPTHRTLAETDNFYRVRLAERVFIKTRPHVVELPLLWGVDSSGNGTCTALLLVLFNGEHNKIKTESYFAMRALEIQNAVEPWHVLFEHHGRLMEWNQAIHGHIIHETRNVLAGIKPKLSAEDHLQVESRIEALWRAYSFVPDSQRSARSRGTALDIVKATDNTARIVLAKSSVRYELTRAVSDEATSTAAVETIPSLIEYILTAFLEDSSALIENLVTAGHVRPEDALITIEAISDFDPATAKERLVVRFRHRVSPAVENFLKAHQHVIGREIIATPTPERLRLHRGLYYVGVLLRNSGGEFLRPVVGEDHVLWSFAFPIVEGRLQTR